MRRGIKDIVEKFHEHPTITHEEYSYGLINSWVIGKSEVFQFLLAQADQGDLEIVRKYDIYKEDSEFRNAIDGAFSNAKLAGNRHNRHALKLELSGKNDGKMNIDAIHSSPSLFFSS